MSMLLMIENSDADGEPAIPRIGQLHQPSEQQHVRGDRQRPSSGRPGGGHAPVAAHHRIPLRQSVSDVDVAAIPAPRQRRPPDGQILCHSAGFRSGSFGQRLADGLLRTVHIQLQEAAQSDRPLRAQDPQEPGAQAQGPR